MKSFTYDLKMPVKIASQGKEVEAVSVEVFAPTNQVMVDVGILDFEFNKARKNAIKESTEMVKGFSIDVIEKIQSKEKDDKVEKLNSAQVVKEMSMNGADLNRCFFALKNILTAGNKEKPVCLVDNEKMTAPIFDSLGYDDTKNILGEYIVSFLDTSRSM